MSTIFAFVKIFDQEDYARAFMGGRLYMNKINYFREYLDEGELRGDDYEGISGIFQPEKTSNLKFGELEIPGKDLSGPILIHDNDILNWNAFCLYSINSGKYSEISEESIEEFRTSLEVHQKYFGMGQFCVLINNPGNFIKKCSDAIVTNRYSGNLGPVDYYNEKEIHGYLDESRRGFQKRSIFKHQNEYRITIKQSIPSSSPLILDIGDLADSTILTTPDGFNEKLKVFLPNSQD